MSAGSESLYLVDAHSLIFQVFHALPEMSSPSGLPTNAVFGFTKDLLYLRNERKPTYLICLFDVPGPTFRDAINAEYKAHRAPMPDDLQLQIPLIHQVLEGMRIPVLGHRGLRSRRSDRDPGDLGAASAAWTSSSAPATRIAGSFSATASRSSTCVSKESYDARVTSQRLGRDAGAGGRLSDAGRRFRGQCQRRPRHRPQDGQQVACRIMRPSIICWPTSTRFPAKKKETCKRRRNHRQQPPVGEAQNRCAVSHEDWDKLAARRVGCAAAWPNCSAAWVSTPSRTGEGGEGPNPTFQAERDLSETETASRLRKASTPRAKRRRGRAETCSPARQMGRSQASLAWEAKYHLVNTPELFDRFLGRAEEAAPLRHRPGNDQSGAAPGGHRRPGVLLAAGGGVVPAVRGPAGDTDARATKTCSHGSSRSSKTRPSARSIRTSSTTCKSCKQHGIQRRPGSSAIRWSPTICCTRANAATAWTSSRRNI